MRDLASWQKSIIWTTATASVAGFCFMAGLNRPSLVLTIEPEPPMAGTAAIQPVAPAPDPVPARANAPRPVSGDAHATPAPHRRSQRRDTTHQGSNP